MEMVLRWEGMGLLVMRRVRGGRLLRVAAVVTAVMNLVVVVVFMRGLVVVVVMMMMKRVGLVRPSRKRRRVDLGRGLVAVVRG